MGFMHRGVFGVGLKLRAGGNGPGFRAYNSGSDVGDSSPYALCVDRFRVYCTSRRFGVSNITPCFAIISTAHIDEMLAVLPLGSRHPAMPLGSWSSVSPLWSEILVCPWDEFSSAAAAIHSVQATACVSSDSASKR